jgi:RNA recognition motif-containing protein
VGNLSWTVRSEELAMHFSSFGTLVSCDVLMETNGRSKGCAIVVMASVEEAQNAVNALHGKDIGGRNIFLREDRETENFVQAVGEPGSSVYVGNLSWVTKWQEVCILTQ